MRIRRMYNAAKILIVMFIIAALAALSAYIISCLNQVQVYETARDSGAVKSEALSAEDKYVAPDTSSAGDLSLINPTDSEYLVLINFDHEYTDRPYLVPNGDVFDADVCRWCNRSCNEVAGRALNEMFREGMKAGYGPFIVNSSYRDRREQTEMWNEKLQSNPDYGKDPYTNPVRAMPPGMSEHETGLAFDVLTEEHPFANKWFGTFPDGIWLRDNCARFGFILRYPKDKTHITGVMYEPWHFRYVGVEAATYMYEHNMCLEEYLGG